MVNSISPPSPASILLRWDSVQRDFIPGEEPAVELVIDSWLVDDGRVRALPAHEARFKAACRTQVVAIDTAQIDDFFSAVIERVSLA